MYMYSIHIVHYTYIFVQICRCPRKQMLKEYEEMYGMTLMVRRVTKMIEYILAKLREAARIQG